MNIYGYILHIIIYVYMYLYMFLNEKFFIARTVLLRDSSYLNI